MFQLLPKIHPLFPMFSALSLPCLPPLFLREDNIAQGAIKINLLVDKLQKMLFNGPELFQKSECVKSFTDVWKSWSHRKKEATC